MNRHCSQYRKEAAPECMEWNGINALKGANVCASVCVHSVVIHRSTCRMCVQKVLFFNFSLCILSLCVGAFSMKPALLLGHRMVTWRPSFALCVSTWVCVCEQLVSACVFVCLAGHEQCADDVKSPWVAFRQSPARSSNHPVYGPYVKTAQRRSWHTTTHTLKPNTSLPFSHRRKLNRLF